MSHLTYVDSKAQRGDVTSPATHTSPRAEVTQMHIWLATKPTPPLLCCRSRPQGHCDSSGTGPTSVSQPVRPCEALVGEQETGSNKAMGPQGPSLCPCSRTPGGTFALSSRGELMQAGPAALARGTKTRQAPGADSKSDEPKLGFSQCRSGDSWETLRKGLVGKPATLLAMGQ